MEGIKMKKLLSLVLALITVMSVATVITGAADADVAETSATYYVSNKPYENVANATIIGYLGDVDGSGEVSILDATQIQLSLASIIAMNSNAKLLADVDRGVDISILDATDIQCFIAKIATTAKVAHTLYTKNSTPSTSAFDQVKNYIKANGEYDASLKWYTIYDFGDTIDTSLIYSVDDDTIHISCDSYGSNNISVSAFLSVANNKADYEYNSILANKYDSNNDIAIYSLFGGANQLNPNDRKLKITNHDFVTSSNITFAKAEPEIQNVISKGFAEIEKKSNGKITNLYKLFG
jgi:hypothetical protein